MLPLSIVQVARGGEEARRGREDTDAAPTAKGQSEAPLRLLPPILYHQGASPLHEGENIELMRKVNRLQLHLILRGRRVYFMYFSKYMKYKRHEETRITCLLQQHFPLSNIAGYNLDGDNQLAKEAALALLAHSRLNIDLNDWPWKAQ